MFEQNHKGSASYYLIWVEIVSALISEVWKRWNLFMLAECGQIQLVLWDEARPYHISSAEIRAPHLAPFSTLVPLLSKCSCTSSRDVSSWRPWLPGKTPWG